ncbi:MAG: branched-chain amino acid ABC transporter permease [Sulfuritalea sp.]|nr:branched-chain amino acid ABC transporter permease [Sulfuritalea sp.]
MNAAPWIAVLAGLALAPVLLDSTWALTLLSQIGIATIACLSFNLLLGQGGMLSFGHATYTGLGAYGAIHTLNAARAAGVDFPVSLVPLAGGVAGLAAATVLGFLSSRRGGTALAMVTLGLAELVFAVALMGFAFFGGESGIAGNRVMGSAPWGVTFASPVQMYYLIAAYALACAASLYALTTTPWGKMLNAVRDNAMRVEFLGANPQSIRYRAFLVAGFFAGVSGGLAALLFERVTPDALGLERSASLVLFTYLGGIQSFIGPVVGAVLMVLANAGLSSLTPAWLLYVGLAFVLVVMYAPHGLTGLLQTAAAQPRALYVRHGGVLLLLLVSLLLAMAGVAALVEMAYQWQLEASLGPRVAFGVFQLQINRWQDWAAACAIVLSAGWFFLRLRRTLTERLGAGA